MQNTLVYPMLFAILDINLRLIKSYLWRESIAAAAWKDNHGLLVVMLAGRTLLLLLHQETRVGLVWVRIRVVVAHRGGSQEGSGNLVAVGSTYAAVAELGPGGVRGVGVSGQGGARLVLAVGRVAVVWNWRLILNGLQFSLISLSCKYFILDNG